MFRLCKAVSLSDRFLQFTMLIIIINTILMASEYNGMPKAMVDAFGIVNLVITIYFALEFVIKLIGLTPR